MPIKLEKYKNNNFFYSQIFPESNFSPWLGDKNFLDVFNAIKDNSYVDIYRCYELWELVKEVNKIDKNASILEVGVWRGGTAAILSKKISLLGNTNKLYLADTFTGVVKASERDNVYIGGEHKDTSIQIVEDLLLKNIGLRNFILLEGVFPEETGKYISTNELIGLCHLDVDVYLSAKDIVNWLFPRLIIGGMIIFDDYGFEICAGITEFVEEQRFMDDRIIIHNLNGHAIIIRVK